MNEEKLAGPGYKGLEVGFPLAPDDEGITTVDLTRDDLTIDDATNIMYQLHPILMAFSLMNCRNVETIRITIPKKLNKKRVSNSKKPLLDYHVINVLPTLNAPAKKVIRHVELGSAVHFKLGEIKFRRGSFASYGPKYGKGLLFGKYEGRYWRPAVQKAETAYDIRVKE